METIKTPFGHLSYVGDLLSNTYPTTIVYKDNNNHPFIVEWLDEDDNCEDVFIIFQVEVEKLKLFCDGIISHLDFIKNVVGKKYFQFKGSINSTKFERINYNNIYKSSLPKDIVYFNSNYSLDYELIAEVFNIKTLDTKAREKYFETLKEKSENSDLGLFRLHILEGKNIGHGTADTRILGELLVSFENLYHEVALDYIRGVERNPKVKNLPEDVLISEMSSTEVYIQEAASFSIYLKSKVDVDVNNKPNKETVSDKIFRKIDKVLSASTKIKDLDAIKNEYSTDVFQSLVGFTETVLDNKVVVDLDYYNSNTKTELRNIMKPADAHTINNNVVSYSKINKITLPFKGKFLMLNTKTGYFVFETIERTEIAGYVDTLIRDNMVSYNFTNQYNVTVNQKSYETLNNKNKITYTLESCLEVKK
jgi:hypothetical protein